MLVGYGFCFVLIFRAFIVATSLRSKVPYVPIKKKYVKEVLKLLDVKEGDHVADLGSGDGRFVFMGAKSSRGSANFYGLEINTLLMLWCRFSWLFKKYRGSINFLKQDILTADLSQYNKVYFYLSRDIIGDVMKKLVEELPKGAIVVSASFGFTNEWEKKLEFEKVKADNEYLYVWKKES